MAKFISNSMSAIKTSFPYVVIGSGLFGLTIAHLIAEKLRKPVLILEKRSHIGGNAWSHIDSKTNIEIHNYGTHIFHTNNEKVWNFVNQFSNFNNYKHQVWSKYNNQLYSLPINLLTLNQFFKKSFSPLEAKEFLQRETSPFKDIQINSFEELALASVGPRLYEAFFKNYTQKQWQTNPLEIPAETFSRLPVRNSLNTNYFTDKYQGQPLDGFFSLINKLAENPLISIETDIDGLDLLNQYDYNGLVIYTGAIDRFFNYRFGNLSWRTLDFEIEILDVDDFQGAAVVNYPELDYPFTRIHEFHHLNPERNKTKNTTVIAREFSRFASASDEPYYPVNSKQDRSMLLKYREKQKEFKNVIFGGRLGSYQYLDMHMAIASAINTFNTEINPN